jgi:hypothetical protein
MINYQSPKPRAVLLAAAVAMSTVTMCALVVLPAELDSFSANASPVTPTVLAKVSTTEARR